jgi:hypothetical protein
MQDCCSLFVFTDKTVMLEILLSFLVDNIY